MIGPEKLSRVTVFFRLACVTPTRFRSTRAKNCGGVFFRGLVPSKQVRLLRLLEAARAAGDEQWLRAHIAAMSIPVGNDIEGPSIKLTISVGVAALDGASRELTDMLAAADAALYYAKETGRNKTHLISATGPAS